MRRAVIDVGSNSVLLLVADLGKDGRWTPLLDTSAVTGLGAGTKESRRLSRHGTHETLDVLRQFYSQARALGAEVAAFGTMALRIADDATDFVAAAERQQTPVSILSADNEARYGFLAVANDPLFADCDRLSVIDPGGHSTELVTAQRTEAGWTTLFQRSHAVGALGLTGTVMQSAMPDFRERLAAVEEVDRSVGLEYRPGQAGQAVVLGATGTNLVTIREALTEWDAEAVHGAELDYEEVGRAVGWLCSMDEAQRAAVPGLEKGREKTIHAGALILERFLYALHVLDCKVSVRGWRHAVLEAL